jgi:hypothetical protein
MYNDSYAPTRGGGGLSVETQNYAPMPSQVAPIYRGQDRMVSTQSYFSLLVKNVTETVDQINTEVKSLGGYLLNTNISRPEQGEDASITIRVPTENVAKIQEFLRSNSVKVVSENISGDDITDQYADIQGRLDTLLTMKRKLQTILEEAKSVEEMLNVQNQLFNVQSQIDSYTGQLKYMEGVSSTSLISVNLSTDELALPYAPAKSWRPALIFKDAVRSLMSTMQGLGGAMIWLGVYSTILIPAAIIVFLVWKIIKR